MMDKALHDMERQQLMPTGACGDRYGQQTATAEALQPTLLRHRSVALEPSITAIFLEYQRF